MQLSRVDLNLFTIFDAIYRDGGITPASKRLHLSQPAVSHALARLRELLDDPLFERRGHDMVPTPLARSIAANVATSLGGLEQLLQRTGRFEPGTSQRAFTIAMREVNELPFLPLLIERLQREAPHVDIAVVRIERRDLEDDLQSGEIDLAFDVGLPLSHDVRRERVTAEPLAVLARENHPSIRGALPIELYLAPKRVPELSDRRRRLGRLMRRWVLRGAVGRETGRAATKALEAVERLELRPLVAQWTLFGSPSSPPARSDDSRSRGDTRL